MQTIGSAGESVAAGIVFTVTGFLFLSPGAGGLEFFRYWPIMMLALAGGFLGVLMMIPLRRALIVQEHGNLTYPEGTACAEVLVAGEKGGAMARLVFNGLWAAMIYKAFNSVLGFFKEIPSYVTGRTAALPNATVNCEIVPEYLGVGYIIGPKVAGIMVSGVVGLKDQTSPELFAYQAMTTALRLADVRLRGVVYINPMSAYETAAILDVTSVITTEPSSHRSVVTFKAGWYCSVVLVS